MPNKTRNNRRKSKNKTKKKFSISNSLYNIPKTVYKSSDFNTIKYPQIPIVKYIALKYANNMVKPSTVKNKKLQKYLHLEYIKRLKILLKKNPRFKKKLNFNYKNTDKISITSLEKNYFRLLNLE
jgi:hypothetical protein